jgi:hypothetical protein
LSREENVQVLTGFLVTKKASGDPHLKKRIATYKYFDGGG